MIWIGYNIELAELVYPVSAIYYKLLKEIENITLINNNLHDYQIPLHRNQQGL